MIATVLGFIFSPVGRYVTIGGVSLLLLSGAYVKGRFDGRAHYKAKIEREIAKAVRKGDAAREKALRDFNALPDDELPNDGFRRD